MSKPQHPPRRTKRVKVVQIDLQTLDQMLMVLDDPRQWSATNIGGIVAGLRQAAQKPAEVEVELKPDELEAPPKKD